MQLVARRTMLSSAAAALAAAALVAGPASAGASATSGGCPDVPALQPFAPWHDGADYILAPEGDVEAGASSWLLEDGAAAVEGNEPFQVGSADDHSSLRLPAGSTATTAPMCIAPEHQTMRFFGSGSTTGALTVQALYTRADGKDKAVTLGTVHGTGAWAPVDALDMRVNDLAADYGNAMSVSLRFIARGDATWQIDDVYVDPFRSR